MRCAWLPSQQKKECAWLFLVFPKYAGLYFKLSLGLKKRSNNFQFKSSLALKYIFLKNQNSLITPLTWDSLEQTSVSCGLG